MFLNILRCALGKRRGRTLRILNMRWGKSKKKKKYKSTRWTSYTALPAVIYIETRAIDASSGYQKTFLLKLFLPPKPHISFLTIGYNLKT